MISKLWFRFGIPLGSATVLATLLDFTFSFYHFLNGFGSFLHFHVLDKTETIDSHAIIGLVYVLLRAFLAICLLAFILTGHRIILLLFLPLSVIIDILLVYHVITNDSRILNDVSDEIWFLNLAVVIIIRLYITSVLYQALTRLLQNAKIEARHQLEVSGKSSEENQNCVGIEEIELEEVKQNGIGDQEQDNCPNNSNCNNNQQQGPRFMLIEPIGESIWDIGEFYNDIPRLGAAVLVIFELVWNIFALSTHSLTKFSLRGDLFFMIREEEVLMRAWRIALDFLAVRFIFKRRKTLLRFWLILYFWTLFGSLCLFVYVITDWFEPPWVQVFVMVWIFVGDNYVRFGIVYFVLRTTMQPPVVTPANSPSKGEVVRSCSLRSTSGPRVKRDRSGSKNKKYQGAKKLQRFTGAESSLNFY